MLKGNCHCGAIQIEIPRIPDAVTSCNCSICRRIGGLWAYFDISEVKIDGHPEHTDGYIWGDKTLRTVRCKTCGCVTHWEPLGTEHGTRMGINMANFNREEVGEVKIRYFDGADTWTFIGEEEK